LFYKHAKDAIDQNSPTFGDSSWSLIIWR